MGRVSKVVHRTFKYRCYPTDTQAAHLAQTFGCIRKVYNLALTARTEAWRAEHKRIDYCATSAMLTAWRKTSELAYLNEVAYVPLQQSLRHLERAFTNFFAKRARYPHFKSKKKSRRSASYTRGAFRLDGQILILAKMREPLPSSGRARFLKACTVHGDRVTGLSRPMVRIPAL